MTRRSSPTPSIDDESINHHRRRPGGGDDEDDDDHPWSYRPGTRTLRRCVCALLAAAIVAASSALVGTLGRQGEGGDGTGHGATAGDGAPWDAAESIAGCGHYTEEDLFRMSSSVDEGCHSEQLTTATGR